MVLYMGIKTGRRRTLTRAVTNTPSPKLFLLTCLIYGLTTVPLAETAGIGSKDTSNGPLLLQRTTNSKINNITSEMNNHNPRTTFNVSSSNNNNYAAYNCPISCQCEYSSSSQTLEISCSLSERRSSSSTPSAEGTSRRTASSSSKLDLSNGVRILRISHVLLDAKSVPVVIPRLVRNTLVELDLEHVSVEPRALFSTSWLLEESGGSLRKISVKGGTLVKSDYFYADMATANVRAILQPLASLERMDSLNICDSSPSLATIVLQAMPPVNHLRVANNSLYEIPYDSLSHQYSIQSIDLSRNHIALIPNGLLEGLPDLLTLDVSQNRIYHLQEQVFTGLKSLRKLNVSHNQIEYVDAEVFSPLREIQAVDLSHNEVVQFFGPYFGNNKKLEILNMSNMWVSGTFTTSDTAPRSLMEIDHLISTLQQAETLDISDNGMRSLPETLTHAPRLQQVYLSGNKWECTCQDRWFLDWVATTKVSIGDNDSTQDMWCFSRKHNGELHRYAFSEFLTNLTRTCTNSDIIARTPYKFHAVMGKNKQLNCHAQKPHWPRITWVTPSKQYISGNWSASASMPSRRSHQSPGAPRVNPDGSLHLPNVTAKDYGLYRCIASYEDLNITHYVHLGMDVSVFRDVRFTSIIVGWVFSFSFLLLVLLFQLVKCILYKLGVRCVLVNTTQQTRRVRAFFDSMEQHKTTQLDWLRDNYNMQAKKIKDNCYSQLERLRDSYSTQTKNLGEIRDYGTQQLHTLRDQYNDQVRKVASYSAHQLCKVRENYVFKRNQVCKFSSHQLLRLRETYKWQAQTLNKILENLPRGLNFDTCRGMGACGRTDSIYLDDMGEDFGIVQDFHPDIYHLGHRGKSSIEKMEHVSLLIPPEFMNDYKRASAEGIENQEISLEHEEKAQCSADIEANVVKEEKEEEDEFVEALEDLSENTSGSTPPTLTLESSESTTRRESEASSSESAPQPSTSASAAAALISEKHNAMPSSASTCSSSDMIKATERQDENV